MSIRVICTVINSLSLDATCSNIACESFSNLSVGTVIPAGQTSVFFSETNDRIFAEFTNSAAGKFQLAMTSPKSTSASACGILGSEGLQCYLNDNPASFTFILGNPNLAGWNTLCGNPDEVIKWGDCS